VAAAQMPNTVAGSGAGVKPPAYTTCPPACSDDAPTPPRLVEVGPVVSPGTAVPPVELGLVIVQLEIGADPVLALGACASAVALVNAMAAITATNPVFRILSPRCMPLVVLATRITKSIYGHAPMRFFERERVCAPWGL